MKGAREKFRKFWLWKPGKILLAVGCCGLLLLTLIPLFRLTVYAVPYYDDYNFGRFARAAMEQEQSKWAAISGALDCSRTQWYAWQGTYSSIFFMALMPAIWGEQYYFLGPVFILLLLLAGTMTFTHVILRKVLGMEKWTGLAAQAVITVAVFMFIYSAQSGFYWYNGGIHYVGMHGFGLLFLSVNCYRAAIYGLGTAFHDHGRKQFCHGIAGTLIAVDDSVYKCGSGTPEKGTVAVACYAGIHYRIWAECSGTGQFRAGPQLCRLGIQSPGVHRQIFSGRSKTSSRVYGIYCSYGNGDAVTPDLAGT